MHHPVLRVSWYYWYFPYINNHPQFHPTPSLHIENFTQVPVLAKIPMDIQNVLHVGHGCIPIKPPPRGKFQPPAQFQLSLW